MKTILSIDFDIIMAPSIELYNNKSGIKWEDRFKESPILQSLPIDAEIYQKIIQLLLELFPKVKKENIHFLRDHHSIAKSLNKNTTYNIINLDHHHDWCYNEKQENRIISDDILDCGNWVKYLSDSNLLEKYTWVKNISSQMPAKKPSFKIQEIRNFSLENDAQIDEIYLIESPEFVPPYYYPLFFIWLDIANQIHNCHYEMEDI